MGKFKAFICKAFTIVKKYVTIVFKFLLHISIRLNDSKEQSEASSSEEEREEDL